MSNRERILGGSVQVGDYITTSKPADVWWKVEEITEERWETPGRHGADGIPVRRFGLVNKAGYRKTIADAPGTGRKLYRWIPASRRTA